MWSCIDFAPSHIAGIGKSLLRVTVPAPCALRANFYCGKRVELPSAALPASLLLKLRLAKTQL
jgi:hypothetical protein